MKGMANGLCALGESDTDCHMKIFIKRSQSFPSFHTIHNDLKLVEIE
jgi:hypothetical protein